MPGNRTILLACPKNIYLSTLYKLNIKRESIFHLLDEFVFVLNKEKHLSNIVSLVKDDASVIVGRYKDFLEY